MSKKLMLLAVVVFGFTLCAAAQGNPAPKGSSNPQPAAGETAAPKTAKKGRKPAKKPSKKVAKGAKTAPATAPATPAATAPTK